MLGRRTTLFVVFVFFVGLGLTTFVACGSDFDEFDTSRPPPAEASPIDGGQAEGAPVDPGVARFDLNAIPDLTIIKGKMLDVPIVITRLNGFSGPIDIVVQDLPVGVSAAPLVLTAESTATLKLTASTSAPDGTIATLKVTGRSGAVSSERPTKLSIIGAPGTLDTSFGNLGVVELTEIAGEDLFLQQDESIVVIGQVRPGQVIQARRLTANGAADPTYADAGTTANVPGQSANRAFTMLADDQIVFVHHDASGEPKLRRITKSGAIDSTFSGGTPVGVDISPNALAVIPNTGGSFFIGSTQGSDIALSLAPPDGGTFTANATIDPSKGWIDAPLRAIPTNSGVLLGGVAVEPVVNGGTSTVLVRLLADAGLDPSFGDGGIVARECVGCPATNGGLAVDPTTGRVIVGGAVRPSSNAVAAVLSNGASDPTFGDGGVVARGTMKVSSVAVQRDQKILVGGSSNANVGSLTRLLRTGALDATFGGGTGSIEPGFAFSINAIKIDRRDRIVVFASDSSAWKTTVARFWP